MIRYQFIILFSLITAVLFNLILVEKANAQLSCSVTTASACASQSGTVIWRMSGSTNAHAELANQSTPAYDNNVVCCTGITGLGNSCSGNYAVVLKLSGATNAHARQNSYSDYSGSNNACISAPSGNTISVNYRSDSCESGEVTLGSMSGATNAHVGNSTAYSTKICVKITGFSTAIDIRAQNYTTNVSSITFPEADPGTTVSQPYNNIDGSGSPQTFGGAGVAKPVVTLYNGGTAALTIWYNITTFTNNVVSSEYYLINNKGAACNSADNINNLVTFDTNTNTGTTISPGAGNEKDFYLKIILSSAAGKTGSSTLTILGEY